MVIYRAPVITSGSDELTQSGETVFTDITPYPGLSPDDAEILDEVAFSLSGDMSLSDTRLAELMNQLATWAAQGGAK